MKRPDIYERVRAALPVARKLLADGIDDDYCEWSDQISSKEPICKSDEDVAKLIEWTSEVYAVGIAVGLSLNGAIICAPDSQARRRRKARPQ